MNINPTISVVIITYNRYNSLKSAVESVLRQSLPPHEIIVLDDGSNDDTVAYLKEIERNVPNLIWKTQKNAGIGKARWAATQMASGNVIAVLDSDDVYDEDAILELYRAFSRHPEADMVYGNVVILDSYGKTIQSNLYPSYKTNNAFKRAIFMKPLIPFKHSSMAFRRESYLDIGGYNDNCKIKVDVDLVLKFIKKKKNILHIDDTIAGHRIHRNNISRNRLSGLRQWYRFIFVYETNLLNRIFYFLSRTVWESLKFGVETMRLLTYAK